MKRQQQQQKKKQEKYKKDKKSKSKIPSKKVHYNKLIYNVWDKKRCHKCNRADPFQFNPWYKKRKKPGRKNGTIAVETEEEQ